MARVRKKRRRPDKPGQSPTDGGRAPAAVDGALPPPPTPPAPRFPRPTLSIALPGSILSNAQSSELRTYLAGQISRAAAIFRVDEVVVFGERDAAAASVGPGGGRRRSSVPVPEAEDLLALLLTYLETPQYLRKHLFPLNPALRLAGLLNPLAATHHLPYDEAFRFREGVVVPPPGGGDSSGGGQPVPSSLVDVGLRRWASLPSPVASGTRVTVDFGAAFTAHEAIPGRHLPAVVVDRSAPRDTPAAGWPAGRYWGYTVRRAATLSAVFEECSYDGGYDLAVGTSEHGAESPADVARLAAAGTYAHAVVVLGGVAGLEFSVQGDPRLEERGVEAAGGAPDGPRVADLFDAYVNVCPTQGSNTIRTEEALLIALARLTPALGL
ncbi:hypothetical protein MMPV_007967 [Pyropia vietnamensis]